MTKRDIALGSALGSNRRAPETHNHVTINQQPHDAADAARLLGELEDKAESKIVDSIRVSNTVFECVVHCFRDEANNQMRFKAVFKINGKTMEASVEVDRQPDPIAMRIKAFQELRDEVAKEIATRAIGDAFVAMERGSYRG